MKRLRLSVSASTVALLLGAGFEAQAQNALFSPPPETYSIDARGVDLLSGRPVRNRRLVSIGQPGSGGLSYDRTYIGGSWRDNVTGAVTLSPDLSIVSVSIGGVTDVFTKSGATYAPRRNLGQTLSLTGGVYTYRTSDGVEYRFDQSLQDQRLSAPQYQANGGRLSRITRPNGEIISFRYETAEEWGEVQGTPEDQKFWAIRLREVSNNFGYALFFHYQQEATPNYLTYGFWQRLAGVTAYNKAECGGGSWNGPSACPGQNWPSVTFDGGKTTDQSGRVTFYGSQGANQLVMRLPENPTVDAIRYTTDANQRVTAVEQAGSTWNYAYAEAGGVRTISTTAPDASVTTAKVDTSSGLLVSIKDPLNRETLYGHDSQRRLSKVTYPQLNSTGYTYDARGNITRITASPPPSVTATPLSVSATYPTSCVNNITCNLPLTTTDARGGVTDYTYDAAHGGLLTVTAPAPTAGTVRPQTRIAYAPQTARYENAAGVLTAAPSPIILPVSSSTCVTGASCAGTADEVKTSIVYGSPGAANNLLPTSTTTGAGDGSLTATTAVTYTAQGDVAAVDGPLPGAADTTTYRYDAARQLVGVVGPDPDGAGALLHRAQRTTYNQNGQVVLSEVGTATGTSDADWAAFNSLQQASASYDAYGRATHQRQQSGGTTHALSQVSYDAAGRLDCTVTRMNPATFASPPASACTATTAGSFGPDRITQNLYDKAGQLVSTTSGVGAGPITERASYTANGMPLTLTDGQGNVSTIEYDGFDRAVKMRYPNATGGGSSTTDYEQYTYDAAGNVTQYRNRAGELIGVQYDALNRAVTQGGSAIADRTFSYDNLDRLTGAAMSGGGSSLSRAWDALGRMTNETQNPLGKTVSYQYDLAGRRTGLAWPDGFFVNYDYNVAGDLTAIRENGATDWNLATYAHDNLGRRTRAYRGNTVPTDYGYDGANRLTSLSHNLRDTAADVTFTFAYNPPGQVVSRTVSNPAYVNTPSLGATGYVNNGKNQVTSVGGSAVTYDARQNIAAAPMGAYVYDGLNQMTSATVAGATTTFGYDPAGRMFQMGATRLLHDGARPMAEYDAAGNIVRRHVPGLIMDETVLSYEGAGFTGRRWLIADERQSAIAYADSTAAAVNINTYDEYGQPTAGNTGLFQYTGQIWLPQAQAYHYKARVYAPQLGRFMQPDPIGYQAGSNLYGYVGGDPINANDPWGLREDSATTVGPIVVIGHRNECQRGATCLSERNEIDNFLSQTVNIADVIISGARKAKERVQSCSSAPISSSEERYSRDGNRLAFWNSRASRGDPLARTALSIVQDRGFGAAANDALATAIFKRNAQAGAPQPLHAVQHEVNQIGIQLMRAHVTAVNEQGSPSAAQVAVYHYGVFAENGLLSSTFGGSFITGTAAEAFASSGIWRSCL
ncbi:RHS repeat domain-containing protein [Brevundimonas sp.]|uniref:RHS repeat domain-containing protein n=1 Tax=Brevundimonas sp. TaxID=1871086 RepID=UPI003D6C8B99